jgi:hypothetical protein
VLYAPTNGLDNYQGEESDIVIVSLTRSNDVGDIGFMSSPQRVNVMLSRARDALIMIGNVETFTNSRKGKEVWVPLMEQLKVDGHVYDGFPVQCERHPGKTALLSSKDGFEKNCPDGGCSEPWYVGQSLMCTETNKDIVVPCCGVGNTFARIGAIDSRIIPRWIAKR